MRKFQILAGVFILTIFIFGFWLSSRGKPYSTLLLTIHKLAGVALGVYLVTRVVQKHQSIGLNSIELAALCLSILFFAGLVASGGLLSTERPMPVVVQFIHKISPYLAVVSSATLFFSDALLRFLGRG